MKASKPWILMAGLLLTAAAGCAKKPAPPSDPGGFPGGFQTGIASWYGPGFHGKRTANGEVYDMQAQTAAHKTLAFDTWVRVHNLDNKKSTVVRINDRGPFVAGRIIDLSKKAARDIGMLGPGTARVRLTISRPPRSYRGSKASGVYSVQVGSFRQSDRAEDLKRQLEGRYDPVEIESATVKGQLFHRVLVGRLGSIQQARNLAERIYRERRPPNRPFVLRRE